MKTHQIALFCTGTLAASLGLAAVLYPFAVVDQDTLARSRAPQPMETLPDVDLGPDFGQLPVVELMGYYIENPPQQSDVGSPKPERQHFGGC
jgi:hypothetical protein